MKQIVYLDFISHVAKSSYRLEGYLGGDGRSNLGKIHIMIGNKKYKLTPTHRIQHQEFLDIDSPIKNSTFEATVKLTDESGRVDFILDGKTLKIKPNRFTGLSRLLFSSRKIGNYIFTSGYHIHYKSESLSNPRTNELLTLLSIFLNWRLIDACRKITVIQRNKYKNIIVEYVKLPIIIMESIASIPYSLILRISFSFTKNKYTKPVWLISDRSMAAGDNGEAFFKYALTRHNDAYDIYFVLSRKSADYQRLRLIGQVVEPSSWRHKILMLHADKVISSQADTETINAYRRQYARFVDLLTFDFIFLQHGIIRHDLSAWLNRFNRNIALFVTSSELEYQSILDNNYYYTEKQVLLSGLARYDLLESDPKCKIILSPTYRNNIVTKKTNKLGIRRYDPDFKNSNYFNFYNNLMNDDRILRAMKKKNMTGELYLHPVFEKQRSDFQENESFKTMEYPYDYRKAFREGSMLISDHSSVVFDFAYLKKPVLYAHFDVDTFFDGHSYDRSNFFSDEENGFGDVCYDYDSLVEKTIELIEANCRMIRKYQQRVDDYFYRTDKNNSQRIYDAILGSVHSEKGTELSSGVSN